MWQVTPLQARVDLVGCSCVTSIHHCITSQCTPPFLFFVLSELGNLQDVAEVQPVNLVWQAVQNSGVEAVQPGVVLVT